MIIAVILLVVAVLLSHDVLVQNLLNHSPWNYSLYGIMQPLMVVLLLLLPLRNLIAAPNERAKILVPGAALWGITIFLMLLPAGAPSDQAFGMMPVFFAIAPVTAMIYGHLSPVLHRYLRIAFLCYALATGAIWITRTVWVYNSFTYSLDEYPMHQGRYTHHLIIEALNSLSENETIPVNISYCTSGSAGDGRNSR